LPGDEALSDARLSVQPNYSLQQMLAVGVELVERLLAPSMAEPQP